MTKLYKILLLSNYKRISLYVYSIFLFLAIIFMGILGIILDNVYPEPSHALGYNKVSSIIFTHIMPGIFIMNILLISFLFYINIYLNTTASSLEILSFSSGLSRKEIFLAKFLNFFTLVSIHFFILYLFALFPLYVGFYLLLNSTEILLGAFLGFLTSVLISIVFYFFMFLVDTLGKKAKTKKNKSFLPISISFLIASFLNIIFPIMETSKPEGFNSSVKINLLSKNDEELKKIQYYKNSSNELDEYKNIGKNPLLINYRSKKLTQEDIASFKNWNYKNDIYTFFPTYLSIIATMNEFSMGGLISEKQIQFYSYKNNGKYEISDKFFDDSSQSLFSAKTNLSKNDIYFDLGNSFFDKYNEYKFVDFSNLSEEYYFKLSYFNDIKYEGIFKTLALEVMKDPRWSGEEVELNSLINELSTLYVAKISEGASQESLDKIEHGSKRDLYNLIIYNLAQNNHLVNKKLKFDINNELIRKMNEFASQKELFQTLETKFNQNSNNLTEEERQKIRELKLLLQEIEQLKNEEPFWKLQTFSKEEALTFIESKPLVPKPEITFPIIFILLAIAASTSFFRYIRKDFV